LIAASIAAAATAMAQDSSIMEGRRARIEKDLRVAENAVDKYAHGVESYLAHPRVKPGDAGLQACTQSFEPAKVYAVAASTSAGYVREALTFEACRALADRSAVGCRQLAALDPTGDAVTNCQQLWRRSVFLTKLRTKAPDADATCRDTLRGALLWKNITAPADKVVAVCAALQTSGSRSEVASAVQALSADEEVSGSFLRLADIALKPGFRCASCRSHCCDDLATFRASRAGDAEACGKSALCRAALGGGASACDGLRDAFARAYCVNSPSAEQTNPAIDSLRRAYTDASTAVAQAMGESEGLEPRADPDNADLITRSRALRKRLNEVPKWGGTDKKGVMTP